MIKFTWRTYLGFIFFLLALLIVISLMVVEGRLAPVLYTWANTRATNLATQAINMAVEETMGANLNSAKMAHLIRDGNNNLEAIQYDMGELNRIVSQAAQRILNTLNDLGEESFPIPLGQIIGLDFLASWGPSIPVKMIAIGGLKTTPVASFESAGINQTWHRIFLDVQVQMQIAVPLVSEEILVSTKVPLLEEVFIGSVPTWYFASQDNLLNSDGRLEFPLK